MDAGASEHNTPCIMLRAMQKELSNPIKTVAVSAGRSDYYEGGWAWQLCFMTARGQDLTYSCQGEEMPCVCVGVGVCVYAGVKGEGKGWVNGDYKWLEILSHAISTVSLFIRLMASWSSLTGRW